MTKLTAIMAIGTYFSPWFPFTVASVYNTVDEIIVINHGFDLQDTSQTGPLPEVASWIKHIDLNGKVVHVTHPERLPLRHRYALGTQAEANERRKTAGGEGLWYDMRGLNLTVANELAFNRGADRILKIDTDQVVYADVSNVKGIIGSVRFYQWEFVGDIGGGACFVADPPPSTHWDDTVEVYRARRDTWYVGGGAIVGYPGSRDHTMVCHSAHLREANPVWLSEEEKLKHLYGRVAWRLYTNEYGRWCPELFARARRDAENILKSRGKQPTDVRPPEACFYQDPVEYIRR